jgi:hypothetical protein
LNKTDETTTKTNTNNNSTAFHHSLDEATTKSLNQNQLKENNKSQILTLPIQNQTAITAASIINLPTIIALSNSADLFTNNTTACITTSSGGIKLPIKKPDNSLDFLDNNNKAKFKPINNQCSSNNKENDLIVNTTTTSHLSNGKISKLLKTVAADSDTENDLNIKYDHENEEEEEVIDDEADDNHEEFKEEEILDESDENFMYDDDLDENNNNYHQNNDSCIDEEHNYDEEDENGDEGDEELEDDEDEELKNQLLISSKSNKRAAAVANFISKKSNSQKQTSTKQNNKNKSINRIDDGQSGIALLANLSTASRSSSSFHASNNNSEFKHSCHECKKSFKTQNILRQHMRIHTGDKPFVCDLCNKAFSQMASLKYHQATHSDDRPFKCDGCSKTFKLKPPFKKHVKDCPQRLALQQQNGTNSGASFSDINPNDYEESVDY